MQETVRADANANVKKKQNPKPFSCFVLFLNVNKMTSVTGNFCSTMLPIQLQPAADSSRS